MHVNPLISFSETLKLVEIFISGWKNKLRWVCRNDEGRHGLEKGITTVFTWTVQ